MSQVEDSEDGYIGNPKPTPTPEPVANAVVYLTNPFSTLMEVHIDTAFDADIYDISVLIDGHETFNTTRVYADEERYKLTGDSPPWVENIVPRVSVQTKHLGDMRCEYDALSDSLPLVKVYKCHWR